MKRINILLSIVIAALFVACSKPSLEEIAIERSKKYISPYDEYVFVEFSSDSICIINRHAVLIEEADTIKPVEYYIMWTPGGKKELVECFYKIEDVENEGRDYLVSHTKADFEESLKEFFDNEQRILRGYAYVRDRTKWIKVEE